MKMKKETVLRALSTFGDEFRVEELVEKLLFLQQIEQGLKDVSENRVISVNDATLRFENKWNS